MSVTCPSLFHNDLITSKTHNPTKQQPRAMVNANPPVNATPLSEKNINAVVVKKANRNNENRLWRYTCSMI
jgi:hypothetical protein